MKVFISWSGNRSKAIAEVLCSWIGQVIQATEPWMSEDIQKGKRWGPKIAEELENTKVGIICLNKENLNSDWLLFEAGALSKTKDAYVCTFLLDVKPADIKQPLAQFQHTIYKKDDIYKLVQTINKSLQKNDKKSLSEKELDEIFEIFWPKLDDKLQEIVDQGVELENPKRPNRELLEEILETVRLLKHEEINKNFGKYLIDELSHGTGEYFKDQLIELTLKDLETNNLLWKSTFNNFKNYIEEDKDET